MEHYEVTVRSHEDQLFVYDAMETPGTPSSAFPSRAVGVVDRRPMNRHTVYELTADEARALKEDDRVVDVMPMSRYDQMIDLPTGWEADNARYSKSGGNLSQDINWGLYRSGFQQDIAGWGSNTVPNNITRDMNCTASGRNVDVVMVDGFIPQQHPQYAENADGTGNTRFIAEDWGQFRPQVDGGSAFNYVYPTDAATLNTAENNHGAHVLGTIAGQSQGWARDANLRLISLYGSNNPNSGQVASINTWNYIRAWHNQKAVNPDTGVINPTIINNSWGSFFVITDPLNVIDEFVFQGTTTTRADVGGQWSQAELQNFGIVEFRFLEAGFSAIIPAWIASREADMQDMINAGIIVVGAAGNSEMGMYVSGDANFDNTVAWNGQTGDFYHRGSNNTSGVGGICVGAASSLDAISKADFSNTGPRIDVWAPGENIQSAVEGNVVQNGTVTTVTDPLNPSFLLTKYDGTSMASPQVCGVLACWLEQNPRATQAEAVRYLTNMGSMPDQLAAGTNGGFNDNADIQGASRNVLRFNYQRPSDLMPAPASVTAFPNASYNARPDTGCAYPRSLRLVTPFATGGTGWNGTITLTSVDFADGSALDNQFWFADFGCPGQNDSPALAYSVAAGSDAIPAGATWTLRCIDVDGGPWTHWFVTNIPSFFRTIAQNETFTGAGGATPQTNDWGQPGQDGNRANGWGGPCPPGGSGLHRYQFQVDLVDDQGTVLGQSNVYTSEITA